MASNSHAFFVAAKRVDAVDRAQVPRLRSCQLGKAYTALLQKVLSSLPKLATRPSPLSVPPHALPYCCIARDADPLQQAGHLWRCAVREPQSTSSRRGRHHSCSIVSLMSLKINTRRSHSRSAAIRWVPHPFLDYHRHWAARTFHHRAHPDPRGHRGTRQSHADGGDGKLMQMGDSASMAYFLGQRSRLYMSCWTTAPRRRDIPANHAAENSRDESALRIGHRCGGSQSCGFLARLVDPWDIDRK